MAGVARKLFNQLISKSSFLKGNHRLLNYHKTITTKKHFQVLSAKLATSRQPHKSALSFPAKPFHLFP
jgi:hypothetical protein